MTDDNPPSDDLDLQVLQAENEALKAEIEELSKQLLEKQEESPEALKELAARAQADLQNAKERMTREAEDMRKFASANLLMNFLPTLDNLKRAFAHLPTELESHDWVKGLVAVEQELLKTLEEAGLEQVTSVGEVADPEHHEVLQTGPGEEDVILEVFEEGYQLHGKVLRPAKVKVGDGS